MMLKTDQRCNIDLGPIKLASTASTDTVGAVMYLASLAAGFAMGVTHQVDCGWSGR